MKSFNIEISDIQFLQEQNSSPIVHIISYDANGKAIYGFTRLVSNVHGAAGEIVVLGALGTFNIMTSEWAEYIPGNSPGIIINNITSGFGLRNVSGLFNNLGNPSSYDWGAIDHPFARLSNAQYDQFGYQTSTNLAFNGQVKLIAADQTTIDGLAGTLWQKLTVDQKKLVQSSNWSQTSVTVNAGVDGTLGTVDDVKSIDNSNRYANPLLTVSDYTPRLISQLVNSSVAGSVNGDPVQSAMDRIEGLAGGTITDHTTYLKNGVTIDENFQRNLNTLSGDPSLTGWNTLFGQFFDHGLDSIGKGGNKVDPNAPGAKIIVPLAPTDPLYNNDPARGPIVTTLSISRATVSNPQQAGADGRFRTADDILSPGVDGVYGNSDDVLGATNPEYINHVSPFIDQSQTYGSSEDVTNLLREWVLDPITGRYVPGMKLLDGNSLANSWTLNNPDGTTVQTKQTLPTLNELRAYLLATGRDDLTWEDISNYRVRDAHGKVFDRDPGIAGTQTVFTGDALLLDILPRLDAAHLLTDPLVGSVGHVNLLARFNAAHIDRGSDKVSASGAYISDYINLQSGQPTTLGISPANGALVNEILLRSISDHYIAGDGRVNENFGLTAIHHVWHEDHNWQIDNLINSVNQQQLADPTHTIAHAWQNMVAPVAGDVVSAGILNVAGHYQDVKGNYVDKTGKISWNQEKMFQSATLIVQMEYQHVAIDQYARGMSPNIPLFALYDSSVNPDVSLDYSQAAFRFGHSQLRETIDVLDPNGSLSGLVTKFALEQAFLNPMQFANVGPTAIAQGMTRQFSSEIDEILTPALQQSLLGQPQDLAAINIMRGRDLGIPALNSLRRSLSNGLAVDLANLQQKLLANPSDTVLQEKIDKTISLQIGLTPYTSWNDFGKNLIHPDALINFLAAYSFDGNLNKANMVVKLGHGGKLSDLTAAETTAYTDLGWTSANARTNALQFLGASSTANKDFENIDAWVGGLAEKHVFLGQLGSTFDAIFVDQMTRLINGDRFYYFWRLQLGLPEFTQLIDSVSTEQFKDVIERTTGASHLTGDVFFATDSHIELGETPTPTAVTADAAGHQYGDKVAANQNVLNADGTVGIGVYSDFGYDTSTDGQVISVNLVDYGVANRNYIQDTRPDVGKNPDGTAAYGFNAHETIGGTRFADFLDAGDGDDTEYGEDGNDILLGNAGADHLYGGNGNDYLAGGTLPDFLDGGDGDDEIHGGDDGDVLIGGDGNDRIYGEAFVDELHGNNGDDYLNAGSDADFIFGGYGNDFILGEEGLDTEYGEWGDDQMFGGAGPDQLFGGQGDDILHGGSGGNNRNLNVDECLGEEGFNISSYSELIVNLDVIGDLNFQNVNPVGTTALQAEPFGQLLVNIQGLEGTGFDDQLIGDASDNWLIGGGGNDIMSGGAGDDVIIGDRVRLDLLDGKYTGNTLGAGLLNLIPSGGGKHFTDLLKSYPNFVFGQDAGAVGANDIVTYAGALSNFTVTRIKDASGNVIKDENGKFLGLRIVDKRLTGAETTAVGDLLIGVDKLVFNYDFESIATAGNTAHVFINPATLPLVSTLGVYAGSLGISSVNNANSANLTVAVTDPNVSTIPGYTYQWYSSPDQGATSTLIPGATLATRSAVSNSLSKVVVSYSDLFGVNTLTSSWVQVGTSGNNNLSGSVTADDILIGLDGNDTLVGGAGNDTMNGGAGNDVLDSHGDSVGADRLSGGIGDDTYGIYNTNTVIVENTGEGNDTVWTAVDYTLSANIENMYVVGNSVAAVTGTGNTGNNHIFGYGSDKHVINGGDGNDSLYGGTGSDTINGDGGDDYLNGGAGVDRLNGGTGNDVLDGGGDSISIDTFAGGVGDDTYGVYNVNTVIIESAAEGNDTVWTIANNYTLADNVENMYLVGALTGTGNAGNNLIVGYGTGNQTINGGAGNDYLNGGIGNDSLVGGAGNDVLDGSGDTIGLDTFVGGADDDVYGVHSANTVIFENALEGNDTVWTTVNNYILADNVENMYLVGALTGTGNAGNNLIAGYGTENHIINGMDGNDSLSGGAGADTMSGGSGADVFAFQFGQSSNLLTDRVLDFTIGTDKIDIFTPAGVAAPRPTLLSRANDNSTATTLLLLAQAAYADANGATAGNQALGNGNAVIVVSTAVGVAGTYLVVDDGVAGFSSNDLMVNITGFSGSLPALGTIPVGSFFKP
jgi:Ca2+-binding RTX toxin-like protein